MEKQNEKFEKMNVRSSVLSLGDFVIAYRRMCLGDIPATSEALLMLQKSIKELCKDISEWTDWFYSVNEVSGDLELPSESSE